MTDSMSPRDELLESVRDPESHFSKYLDQLRVPRFEQMPPDYTIGFGGHEFKVGDIQATRARQQS